MTAIAEGTQGSEPATFEDWAERIASPPSGSTEAMQAAAAASWILDTYLDDPRYPERELYRTKVTPWALTDMVLFGKLGTAVGRYAVPGTDTQCVGYWKEEGGSTMAWEMSLTAGGTGRYLFGGKIDRSIKVTDVVLFDVTGVVLGNDPDTALLTSKRPGVSLGAAPRYADVTTLLEQIKAGNWP